MPAIKKRSKMPSMEEPKVIQEALFAVPVETLPVDENRLAWSRWKRRCPIKLENKLIRHAMKERPEVAGTLEALISGHLKTLSPEAKAILKPSTVSSIQSWLEDRPSCPWM